MAYLGFAILNGIVNMAQHECYAVLVRQVEREELDHIEVLDLGAQY
jgi:hypothetical protein